MEDYNYSNQKNHRGDGQRGRGNRGRGRGRGYKDNDPNQRGRDRRDGNENDNRNNKNNKKYEGNKKEKIPDRDEKRLDKKEEYKKSGPITVIEEKKPVYSANDWMSMLGGGKATDYEAQEKEKRDKEEAVKQEQLKKEQEEKEIKRKQKEEEQKIIDAELQKQKEEELAKNPQSVQANENQQKTGEDDTNKTEEQKQEELKAKKKKTVIPENFDINNLESFWTDTGKKKKTDAPVITYAKQPAKKGNFYNQDVNLNLTKELSFSMTNFDKVNKGLANQNINCYMNVALQSLMACPAFFNLLTMVGQVTAEDPIYYENFKKRELLLKCIELSRFFDPKVLQNDENKYYSKKIVDAQQIFHSELRAFNPENIQQDCSEFITLILDKLHEEVKDLYVSNENNDEILDKENETKQKKANDDLAWNETGEKNQKVVFRNPDLENQIEQSIIRDIFGGILRTEFHVEGTRKNNVQFEPQFVLSLDITEDECTIEDCLDYYFRQQPVEGYQMNGKTVKAFQRQMFEKLPNILMINLKRFVYTDRLIKKKEHVYFEDILTIEDKHVSNQLQLGIFKKSSEAGSKRNYRLFSVVEHIGKQATQGHYVCYTLDTGNKWIKFDDKKFIEKDYGDIKDDCQAYMLFYELIQD